MQPTHTFSTAWLTQLDEQRNRWWSMRALHFHLFRWSQNSVSAANKIYIYIFMHIICVIRAVRQTSYCLRPLDCAYVSVCVCAELLFGCLFQNGSSNTQRTHINGEMSIHSCMTNANIRCHGFTEGARNQEEINTHDSSHTYTHTYNTYICKYVCLYRYHKIIRYYIHKIHMNVAIVFWTIWMYKQQCTEKKPTTERIFQRFTFWN